MPAPSRTWSPHPQRPPSLPATAKTMGQERVELGAHVSGQSAATGVCRRSVTGNGWPSVENTYLWGLNVPPRKKECKARSARTDCV